MHDVVAAKVQQAISLLDEFDLPLWIVQFGRETYDHPQPVQELMVGTSVTWPAAFIVARDGSSTAIVGTGDVSNVRGVSAYDDIQAYVKDVTPLLLQQIQRHDPPRIGVSYSVDDDSADNISHGMFLILQRCFEGTPYAGRIVSADRALVALRARKLQLEVERIRRAVDETLHLFDLIQRELRPGVTERSIADAVHHEIERRGWLTAWDRAYDPAVHIGPASAFGHSGPGDIQLQPGHLVHVDLGIKLDGYCSDLQRTWYVLKDGEDHAPDEVQRPFDLLLRSMQTGFDALRPGIPGAEVDAAARAVIVSGGYSEPEFSLGHQLGQTTHDGGTLLGPRWPRYGDRPDMLIEEGSVFTLEYGLPSPAGWIGLEEDVLVTSSGAEYLCEPQTELKLVRP